MIFTIPPQGQVCITEPDAKTKEVIKDAKEQYLEIIFILNANKYNFVKYRDDYSNSFQSYN